MVLVVVGILVVKVYIEGRRHHVHVTSSVDLGPVLNRGLVPPIEDAIHYQRCNDPGEEGSNCHVDVFCGEKFSVFVKALLISRSYTL